MGTRQVKVRLRDALHSRLAAVAAENGRTLNGEIVERLAASFRADDRQMLLAQIEILARRVDVLERKDQQLTVPPNYLPTTTWAGR